MKVTKFGHSCIYVELDGKTVLFDPGIFTRVPVDDIAKLDYICISHEHQDHFDREVAKQLAAKFPKALVIAPYVLHDEIRSLGLKPAETLPAEFTRFTSPHESITPFGGKAPEQMGIHFASVLTHPGDSHSFTETKAILALPIVGPWGSARRAVEVGLELKPRMVIPIHDWFLSSQATIWYYDGMVKVFAEHGIEFIPLKAGESIELDETAIR